MIKSGKEKFYLTFFAFFALAAVLIWQEIINGRLNIDSGASEVKEKNITIAAYGTRENTLKKNLENYNFAINKALEANKYFVDEDNLPDFIKEIENISDQTSNKLSLEFADNSGAAAIAQGAAKAGASGAADSYVLKLNLSGTFDNLMQFMARIESSPYYSYIDSVMIDAGSSSYGLQASSKTPSSVNLQTSLTMRVFKKQNLNGQK